MSIASEITRLQTAKADLKTAIEGKGVTVSSSATLDDYADLVNEISGGGDGGEYEWAEEPIDDVTFVDYDGTVLYTYSADEFLALEAMPDNPTHDGLVAQGWNSTLQEAQTYVSEWGTLCIGQNYTTTDGATKVYITVTNNTIGLYYYVRLYTSAQGGVTVDWGDGNSDVSTANAGALATLTHAYDTVGNYVISIACTSGTCSLGYTGSNNGGFVTTSDRDSFSTAETIKKIHFGNGLIKMNRNSLYGVNNLTTISIPTTLKTFGESASISHAFNGRTSLRCIVFPKESVLHSSSTQPSLGSLYQVRFISFALSMSIDDLSTVNGASTANLRKLRMFTPPPDVPRASYVIYNTPNLERFCYPGTYDTVKGGTLREVLWVKKVIIPATVTTWADYAMTNTYLRELHMRPTTPPTISNTRGLPSMVDITIYVPYSADHSVLEAYQTATNWSTYASKIVEENV